MDMHEVFIKEESNFDVLGEEDLSQDNATSSLECVATQPVIKVDSQDNLEGREEIIPLELVSVKQELPNIFLGTENEQQHEIEGEFIGDTMTADSINFETVIVAGNVKVESNNGFCENLSYQSDVVSIEKDPVCNDFIDECKNDFFSFPLGEDVNAQKHGGPNQQFCGAVLSCAYCGLVFSSPLYHSHHEKVCAKKGQDSSSENCAVNENKDFGENLHELNKHVVSDSSLNNEHSGEMYFSCSTCNKIFTSASDLNLHIRVHMGDKPYYCNTCNKKFTSSSGLDYHGRAHTGAKLYTCIICNDRFSTYNSLSQHVHLHTRNKPFSCSVCNKKFNESSRLKRHIMSHNGMKPFRCNVCNKQFSTSGSLKLHTTFSHQYKQHFRFHIRKNHFPCTICDKNFTSNSGLNKHMKKFHFT